MARACSFDREEKLVIAMELFWHKGYANTAISDLVEALGINRFSLYNSYGDKQALYYQALDHYLTKVSLPKLTALSRPDASLPEVEVFLNKFVEMQKNASCGCFLQNAIVEHAGADQHVLDLSHKLFDHLVDVLTVALSNAQHRHQVTTKISSADLAQIVLVQIQGMRVLAKAQRFEQMETTLQQLLVLMRNE